MWDISVSLDERYYRTYSLWNAQVVQRISSRSEVVFVHDSFGAIRPNTNWLWLVSQQDWHSTACVMAKNCRFKQLLVSWFMVHCQLGLAWTIEMSVMLPLVLTESTHRSARVAQWIRRRSPKPKIGGSSPPVGTCTFYGWPGRWISSMFGRLIQHHHDRGCSSVVERSLCMWKARGSIPRISTLFCQDASHRQLWPSG